MAQMHEVDYKIFGDDMQFVEVELDPQEAALAEAGGMMYMDDGIEMQTIFGDGSQLRDFVYVDDAADAFLRAGASDVCDGGVFNVGGDAPVSHRDLTQLLVTLAGSGSVKFVEWPPEKKRIDIGSFYSDSSRFRGATGWLPQVSLEEGLRRTLSFYREHLREYISDSTAFEMTG